MHQSDEITLAEIVSRIWKRRGLMVICSLIGLLIGCVTALLSNLQSNSFVEYYISLEGVQKSTYPNGTLFSPQDLLISDVLRAVAEENGIENHSQLRSALSIQFGSPVGIGITNKYQAQLGQRRLSAADIDAINARYSEELLRATESGLRIAIDPDVIGIDAKTAQNILVELPESWAKVFTKRYRVFDDRSLQGVSISTLQPLTTPLGVIEADRMFDNLIFGLGVLSNDNRLSALQASGGVTAADLSRTLADFNDIFLTPILASRLAENNFLTEAYINSFRLKITEIDQNLAGLNQTVSDIRVIMDGQFDVPAGAPGGDRGGALEIDGSALDDIVTLANQASLSNYLQTLFDKQSSLISQRAELRTRIDRIAQSGVVDARFTSLAQSRLDYIINTYNELLKNARSQTRTEFASLYRPISPPTIVSESWTRRAILSISGGLLMGVLFGLLATLVWRR